MNRIKYLRDEQKILQEDLAQKLGVTQKTISNYENEARDIPTEFLKKMSEIFNCTIDYLLGKSDIRNPEELKSVQFANAGGLDANGIDDDELAELQKQIDYMKWKKENEKKDGKK